MDWQSEDKVTTFTTFRTRMKMYLTVTKVAQDLQWNHIVLLMGEEGLRRWEMFNMSEADRKDPEKVWKAFEDSLEKTHSSWNYIDEYLGDFRQGPTETTAELDVRIQTLARKCKFRQDEVENRKIDLLFHATRHFEVKKYTKERQHGDVTYNQLLEQAKLHERVIDEYRAHKQMDGQPVYTETSGTVPKVKLEPKDEKVDAVHRRRNKKPSFQDHRKKKERERSCDKCGSRHRPRECPAYGKDCYACGGRNHFERMCNEVTTETGTDMSEPESPPRGRRHRGNDHRRSRDEQSHSSQRRYHQYGIRQRHSEPDSAPTTDFEESEMSDSVITYVFK